MATVLVRSDILYAWRGPSLVILGPDGIAGASHPLSGFYHREARFLSKARLTINGREPWLCETAAVRPDLLHFNYVYPEIAAPGGGGTGWSDDREHVDQDGVPERTLDVRTSWLVHAAALEITVLITNRALRTVHARVEADLDADFADIQEAQSGRRLQQGDVDRTWSKGRIRFAYRHPDLPDYAEIHVGEHWDAGPAGAAADLSLAPHETRELGLRIVPHVAGEEMPDADAAERERVQEAWARGLAQIAVPGNRLAERVVTANIEDVASFPTLTGAPDEWLAFQAGMPLYPAFFGRDALTAGWQAAMIDSGAALDAALTRLGRLQSDRDDDWHDEEPGRIPYQMRSGPLARLNLNPYSAYYADFASPLMYVIALANLFAWTGDLGRIRAHWDTARRILEWARERGDRDRDGYLEYLTRSREGTKNQGWKDSGDAIVYDDGRPVPAPIATCELQGYWYVAQELMAILCMAMGRRDEADGYRRSAADLKARFNRDWWVPEEQCVALALDPDKMRVGAVTSNAGHCLATGIIDQDRVPPVVGRLFAPDMFSGWGVRTLSSRHAYYDPLSYHRGTVWAVEQATIVFGLRRFGFDARAMDLTRALFELAELYPGYRIPECVGGYSRGERPTPGAYPRANTPQLWNASAFPLLIQTTLGLVPLAPVNTLVIDPVLPAWMPDILIRGLRVGAARVSLRFRRDADGHTDWDVTHLQGKLRVIRQPAPESLTVGVGDRTAALMETLL